MAVSTVRIIACVGALTTGLLVGVAPTAFAEETDTTEDPGATGSQDPAGPPEVSVGFDGPPPDGTPGDGSPAGGATRPTSTIGNGRNDVASAANDTTPASERTADAAKPTQRFRLSFTVPMLRIPTRTEHATAGITPPAVYFAATEIRISTLKDLLGFPDTEIEPNADPDPELEPEPEPAPGPSFRTRQEQPQAPVLDVTPGDGGGVDQTDAGTDTPPVISAPVVAPPGGGPRAVPPRIAPRVIPPPLSVAPGARLAPIGASAARAATVPSATPPGAGARPAGAPPAGAPPAGTAPGAARPPVRGSLAPAAPTGRPTGGTTGQPGETLPRYLRTPTVAELAAVALPGVGGLMFLTFSGGVIGYRQANAARFLRTGDAARFLP